jgi:hypothetical protein
MIADRVDIAPDCVRIKAPKGSFCGNLWGLAIHLGLCYAECLMTPVQRWDAHEVAFTVTDCHANFCAGVILAATSCRPDSQVVS